MNKQFKQLISFLLVITLMMQLLPPTAFATGAETVVPVSEEAPTVTDSDPEVYILGEKSEAREENVKHYYLTDGSFMATQFQVPVHYEDEGQWVDIDNTLQPVTMFDGTDVYQAVNGEHVQAFAATLEDGTVMSMADGDAAISMSLWEGTEDPAAEESVPVEEPQETVPEETAASETEATEPTETEPPETEATEPEETTLPMEEETAPTETAPSETEATEATEPTEAAPSPVPEDSTDEETTPTESIPGESTEPAETVPAESEETVPAESEETVPDETEAEAAVIQADADTNVRLFNRQAQAQILGDTAATFALTDEETELRSVDDVIPDTLSSTVLYEDVYPGVDLQYDLFSYNVKESIIVKQPLTSAGENPYVFTFLLRLTDLTPAAQEDGSILLVNSENETVYTIPAPYMVDNTGVYSDAVTYTMTQHNEGWLLTVTADEDWMNDEGRSFPVVIDPSFNANSSNTVLSGTASASNGQPTSGVLGSGDVVVGYHATYGTMEGFVRVKSLTDLPVGSVIVKARLKLNPESQTLGTQKYIRMDISKMTSSLTNSQWSAYLPWASKPSSDLEDGAMDFLEVSSNSSGAIDYGLVRWDITRAVQEWYDTRDGNYGLRITSPAPETDGQSVWMRWGFGSGSAVLTITYRDTTGIESYYTYATQSAGRAGIGYVGDYSSNLTVVKTDGSYSSTTMPFSIGHVYNSSMGTSELSSLNLKIPDYSNMKLGTGWQLTAMESIKHTTIASNTHLVYRDSDGTIHYCAPISTTQYQDEDGLGLTITYNGNEYYSMTDLSGNKKYFYYGYLMYQEDSTGNRICYLYNGDSHGSTLSQWYPKSSGNYLSSIVSVNKGQKAQTIYTFSYDSNHYLTSITDYAGRVTRFTYDSGAVGKKKLISITHPDGIITNYSYDASGLLSNMYDNETKYGIEYTYSSGNVNAFKEFTADSLSGNKSYGTTAAYEKNGIQESYYRYHSTSDGTNTENDIVNRCSFDFYGRTINKVSLNHDESTIMGVSAGTYEETSSSSPEKNNHIKTSAQSGQNGINLLMAGGAENQENIAAEWYWEKNRDDTNNHNAVVKPGESVRTGSNALKLWTNTSASADSDGTRMIGIYQNIILKANQKYTFSAYVNTQSVTSFAQGGGVFLALTDSSGNILASSDRITTQTSAQIENGWQRIYMTFTCPSYGYYRIMVAQDNVFGSSYFDDLQLEIGTVPSNVNLLQNGSFNILIQGALSGWTTTSFSQVSSTDSIRAHVATASGVHDEMVRARQRIPIYAPAGETFLLSGWGKASSAANTEQDLGWSDWNSDTVDNDQRYFGFIAKCVFQKSGSETTHSQYFYMPFNDDYDDWQFASCVIVPDSYYVDEGMTLNYIDVIAVYDNNFNTVALDNVSLVKEPCTTYTYTEDGNVSAVNTTGTGVSSAWYYEGTSRMHTSKSSAGGVNYYGYENTNDKYLLTYIHNHQTGLSTDYGYDTAGNLVTTSIGRWTNETADRTIQSSIAYYDTSDDPTTTTENDGLYNLSLVQSETHTNGQTTTYKYDKYRNVDEVITPQSTGTGTTTVNTDYYSNDRVGFSYISGTVSLTYNYSQGLLDSIIRGGWIPGDTEKKNQTYSLAYDDFGNMTSVSVGNIPLATYEYGSNNGDLLSMIYGNGQAIEYEYDNLDRVTEERWANGPTYQYFYNAEGSLTKKLDTDTGDAVNYEYDSLDRLIHSYQVNGDGDISQRTEHLYDTSNRLSSQTWQLLNSNGQYTTYSETYTYDVGDDALTYVDGNCFGDYAYTYDILRRLDTKYCYRYTQKFNYLDLSNSRTTTQVARIDYTAGSGELPFSDFSLAYEYDNLGNIKKITGTSISGHDAQYTYDIQGQLTQEKNSQGTYNYTYDTYGNIRSVQKGTETPVQYSYDNTEWRDLLTAYNGKKIAYEGQTYYGAENVVQGDPVSGNPISYYNGTRWTFEWEKGRQLAGATVGTKTYTYTYDLAGIRSSKTVNGITYNYLTQNGKVVRQTWTEDGLDKFMDFIYDNSGRPYAMVSGDFTTRTSHTYYFILNQQGDVIRIIGSGGTIVAEYVYNAWGKVIASSGWMAPYNPIRYRGYYYDNETGFYYLQSRYYDPSIGRFINADQYTSTGQSFIGCNMFAYCGNNPVQNCDSSGKAWWNPMDAILNLCADIYNIFRSDGKGVAVEYNAEKQSIRIKNSAVIKTSTVMVGYSMYVNHVNKTSKDAIKGSTTGVVYEWAVHTAVYNCLEPITTAMESLGISDSSAYQKLINYQESGREVDLESTVFADDSHGIASLGMQLLYVFIFPFHAEYDLYIQDIGG